MGKKVKLKFFNTTCDEKLFEESFGCATMGIATHNQWYDPKNKKAIEFNKAIEGIVICENLQAAKKRLLDINEQDIKSVKAGIVLFGNCGDENKFIEFLGNKFKGVPFVGGSSAIGDDGVKRRLLPQNKEVSLLLITDNDYEIKTQTCNVYSEIVTEFVVLENEKRIIDKVNIGNKEFRIKDFIATVATEKRIDSGITERFSISDDTGRNIHLIPDGNKFICGADLPKNRRLFLKYTTCENVYEKMKNFYSEDNSIIFGCAGVKSMLKGKKLYTGKDAIGLFMFGEVTCINGKNDFANLMLTRISFKKI